VIVEYDKISYHIKLIIKKTNMTGETQFEPIILEPGKLTKGFSEIKKNPLKKPEIASSGSPPNEPPENPENTLPNSEKVDKSTNPSYKNLSPEENILPNFDPYSEKVDISKDKDLSSQVENISPKPQNPEIINENPFKGIPRVEEKPPKPENPTISKDKPYEDFPIK
jgi:hypothetical protein